MVSFAGTNVRAVNQTSQADDSRFILEPRRIHAAIRERIANNQRDIVEEVESALSEYDIVIVGLKQNPHVAKARRLVEAKGLTPQMLIYGSYLGKWRRRNALKMWTGCPTFPMVFVKGVLIGGASDLERLTQSGELSSLLDSNDRISSVR